MPLVGAVAVVVRRQTTMKIELYSRVYTAVPGVVGAVVGLIKLLRWPLYPDLYQAAQEHLDKDLQAEHRT
jgi:hypothetical protein